MKKYLSRIRLVLQLELNACNKIKAINNWDVSLKRYGEGIITWKKDELQKFDRHTRKLTTLKRKLNPKLCFVLSNLCRLLGFMHVIKKMKEVY